jgi:putative ABC transport system permease protein
MTGTKVMSALRRVTGLGAAGSLAFALLAGGCVLAATAGPRQAQATQVRALRETVSQLSPLDKSIVVTSGSAAVTDAFFNAGTDFPGLAQPDFDNVTAQLHHDFSKPPLTPAPQSADSWAMTTPLYNVASAPRNTVGYPEQAEVVDASPGAAGLRLLAGGMPGSVLRPNTGKHKASFTIEVAVTQQTASKFGLRPGSVLGLGGELPVDADSSQPSLVDLYVTGIVEPAHPRAVFWATDPLLAGPLVVATESGTYLDGAFFASAGEMGTIQSVFGGPFGELSFQWVLPIDTSGLNGPAQALFNQVNEIASAVPPLTGPLAPMAPALTASSSLLTPLAAFIRAMNDVQNLLQILYVGLAVAAAVVLLLAARAIAARRSAELAVLRARGASLWQLFARGALGAALACGPAAALAWAAAVALIPDAAPTGPASWWPGLATAAVAVAGPGAVSAWQHRLPRRRRARGRRWRWVPRVVFEVTACAAAIGGIEVFRAQSGATGLYASAAPVLIAIPTVIVMVRLYQVALGWLARVSARQRGLTGFLGLTRAALAGGTRALPAMTLVLLLTLAAFTGMVRTAVARGEVAASWQAAGADAVVTASSYVSINAAAQRAIAAVPGVQHAAAALVLPAYLPDGQVMTAIAVDPASYAAVVASAQGFAPVRPALLTGPHGGAVPVLASPQAAVTLRQPDNGMVSAPQYGVAGFPVRITGVLASTPALPAGGPFIVLPLSAIHGISVPQANLMLLNGSSIDLAKLNAAVGATIPGTGAAYVSTRAQALQDLTQAPAQQGTFLFFTLALAYAAVLAVAVMLLELAMGATEREVTLARLATMGLAEGQRVRLVAIELLPAIAASAAAAAVCAIALPGLVGQQINLSVFTQSGTSPSLRVDAASVLVPLAGLLVVTVIALAHEVRSGRGRGVAVTMRT